jgi:hypothetical protein
MFAGYFKVLYEGFGNPKYAYNILVNMVASENWELNQEKDSMIIKMDIKS